MIARLGTVGMLASLATVIIKELLENGPQRDVVARLGGRIRHGDGSAVAADYLAEVLVRPG